MVAQQLGEQDLIVSGLPQVLSTQHTVIILEEGGLLTPYLLLERVLVELVFLLLRQDLATLKRDRKFCLIMLVRNHTVVTFSLHQTRNKNVMGIEDKVSLITVIVVILGKFAV